MLVDMGLIAYCGIMQLAPAILGALFWKKANRFGAIAGDGAGDSLLRLYAGVSRLDPGRLVFPEHPGKRPPGPGSLTPWLSWG